jgi:hypothetical protein
MSIGTFILAEAATSAATSAANVPSNGVAWAFLAFVALLWLAKWEKS